MFAWLKRLFQRRRYTIDSLVKGSEGSLVKLQFLISDAVKYQHDDKPEDEWKRSSKTLADGYGDCEDFAIVWMDCLSMLGIRSKLYACLFEKTPEKNHAILLFRYRDKWCYTSNQYFIATNITDKEEALQYAYPADKYEVII